MEDITLSNILSSKTLKRLSKDSNISGTQRLSDFCLKHTKTMEELSRIFYKTHSFHQLGISDIVEDQNCIIIREYCENIIHNQQSE